MVCRTPLYLHVKGTSTSTEFEKDPQNSMEDVRTPTRSIYFRKVFHDEHRDADMYKVSVEPLVKLFLDGFNSSFVHLGTINVDRRQSFKCIKFKPN